MFASLIFAGVLPLLAAADYASYVALTPNGSPTQTVSASTFAEMRWGGTVSTLVSRFMKNYLKLASFRQLSSGAVALMHICNMLSLPPPARKLKLQAQGRSSLLLRRMEGMEQS